MTTATETTELLETVQGHYGYYHEQMWYYKRMLKAFKRENAFLNGSAIFLVALGMIVGGVWPDSFGIIVLTALSACIKGWTDFQKYSHKIAMCYFAYTTFEKILAELDKYVRGALTDGMGEFLARSQIHEETIIDLTPPVPERLITLYKKLHKNVGAPV